MSDTGRATSDNKYNVCVLQRHKVSLANIRDWNISNICLFYYFYALKGIFISFGGYFTVNKGVLRCPVVYCGVLWCSVVISRTDFLVQSTAGTAKVRKECS